MANNEQGTKLERPSTITLAWLFQHMPLSGWFSIAAAIVFVFGLGVLVGNTSFVREMYGIEDSPSPSGSSESAPRLPPTEIHDPTIMRAPADVKIASETYGNIFEPANAYPIGYQRVTLGTQLSVLKKVYPSAEYDAGWETWSVDVADGAFDSVRFSTESDKSDPKVTWLEFFYRDEAAMAHVRAQALAIFGSDTAASRNLGEELEWNDINGVHVTIDSSRYSLSRVSRDRRSPPNKAPQPTQ